MKSKCEHCGGTDFRGVLLYRNGCPLLAECLVCGVPYEKNLETDEGLCPVCESNFNRKKKK